MDLFHDPRVAMYQQAARRATTAMTILDVGAWVGLIAGIVFWSGFFYVMVEPVSLIDWVLVLVMAICYAIVLPMLLSALVPSTPAGMLLQQTRARTWGFAATIGAVGFLGYHALTVLWAYWASKPNAVGTGQDLALAFGSLIIFVLVPALAWVQTVPDRWLAEVQAAMAVRRLKMAQEANIMAMKTQYVRTIALLRRGVANLTVRECEELAGGIVMFQRAENEALGQIVDTLDVLTGFSTGVRVLDDAELERAYTGITDQLAGLIDAKTNAYSVELPPPAVAAGASPPAMVSAAEAPIAPSPQGAHQEALERDAQTAAANTTVRHGDAPRRTVTHGGAGGDTTHEAFLATAQERLGQTWTVKQLAEALGVSESQAREFVNAWVDAGLVDKTKLRGFYSFAGEA